ncbi:hypothetical protein G4B88_028350 [Cannabis sativa]|uniref:Pentatricopeptide repeat-containing protein n=1 Tax=Cannabis sativa TaxID=3483 RepID=A0A7J6FHA1_CANSA|nr:hypothetical protein G4B88_028350 [Cannabis sativa]
MKGGGSATEFASRRSRALIAASNYTKPTRSWSPSLKNTLHRLRCRNSLTPSLVARVIDPFLLPHHSLALGFFNWAAQQLVFAGYFELAQKVFDEMSQKGVPFTTLGFGVFIWRYVRKLNWVLF